MAEGVECFNSLRDSRERVLGTHNSLPQLQERLGSLTHNCLAGPTEGLGVMAHGDLTFSVTPVTSPISNEGGELGTIATTFTTMLDSMVSSVNDDNATRAQLAETITEVRDLAGSVAASSQQMNATAQETGRSIDGIAVAAGIGDEAVELSSRAKEIAAASQQSSAPSVEVASSSEELARTAERLAELMQRFVTDSNESHPEVRGFLLSPLPLPPRREGKRYDPVLDSLHNAARLRARRDAIIPP